MTDTLAALKAEWDAHHIGSADCYKMLEPPQECVDCDTFFALVAVAEGLERENAKLNAVVPVALKNGMLKVGEALIDRAAELDALRAANGRLREALQPFADFGEARERGRNITDPHYRIVAFWGPTHADTLMSGAPDVEITIGTLRAARAALAQDDAPQGGTTK